MRLKLISCEVLYRELCYAVSRSPHIVDIEFLPKGLHDIGCTGMLARLQTALDGVDPATYDAVIFGYGLCNNGIAGLKAGSTPLRDASRPRLYDPLSGKQGTVPQTFQ